MVGVGFVVAAYLSYVGIAWLRYGHARQPAASDETDVLLDQFMPEYEVAEHHHIPAKNYATGWCSGGRSVNSGWQTLAGSPLSLRPHPAFRGANLVVG